MLRSLPRAVPALSCGGAKAARVALHHITHKSQLLAPLSRVPTSGLGARPYSGRKLLTSISAFVQRDNVYVCFVPQFREIELVFLTIFAVTFIICWFPTLSKICERMGHFLAFPKY